MTSFDPKERHQYRRHAIGIVVTWYTWFVALSYGVVGWLATSETTTKRALWFIAIAFVSHTVVGTYALHHALKYFKNEFADVSDPHEKAIGTTYIAAIQAISIMLFTMIVIWLLIPFFLPTKK